MKRKKKNPSSKISRGRKGGKKALKKKILGEERERKKGRVWFFPFSGGKRGKGKGRVGEGGGGGVPFFLLSTEGKEHYIYLRLTMKRERKRKKKGKKDPIGGKERGKRGGCSLYSQISHRKKRGRESWLASGKEEAV